MEGAHDHPVPSTNTVMIVRQSNHLVLAPGVWNLRNKQTSCYGICTFSNHQLVFYLFCEHLPDIFFWKILQVQFYLTNCLLDKNYSIKKWIKFLCQSCYGNFPFILFIVKASIGILSFLPPSSCFFLLKIFTSSILPNWISKYYIHTPLKNESSFFAKSYLAMGIFHSFCTLSKHQLAFYLFCHHLPDFFFWKFLQVQYYLTNC